MTSGRDLHIRLLKASNWSLLNIKPMPLLEFYLVPSLETTSLLYIFLYVPPVFSGGLIAKNPLKLKCPGATRLPFSLQIFSDLWNERNWYYWLQRIVDKCTKSALFIKVSIFYVHVSSYVHVIFYREFSEFRNGWRFYFL